MVGIIEVMTAPEVSFHGLPETVDAGDGVTLRRLTVDDVPDVVEAVNSSLETLRPWMPWAQEPASVEAQLEWFRSAELAWAEGTGFHYAVLVDGAIAGGAGYHVRNGPGVLEIGYWLRAGCEGQGHMTRAARALTDTAARVDGVTRVEIHCDPANVKSAAIPLRLGYSLVGERDAECLAPAHTGREQIWAIDAAACR